VFKKIKQLSINLIIDIDSYRVFLFVVVVVVVFAVRSVAIL
jgi:hypothetical protein